MTVENSKYEAIFKCGFCNKETPIPDKGFEEIIKGDKPWFDEVPCSCGHHSYASKVMAKVAMRTGDWHYRLKSIE